MKTKRSASKQVAFRIEPQLAIEWSTFTADTLIPRRAHHACAMVLYLAASTGRREQVQRLYARFQRTGKLEAPPAASAECDGSSGALSPEELEMLAAYRRATAKARDEALVNLQEQPDSSARSAGSAERRDHRAG